MKKQERNNQTKSIQEMAAGDLQDAELIRMKKFLQVQIFLKSILKDKMQRLKNFYEPYELAFFQIKSQTVIFYLFRALKKPTLSNPNSSTSSPSTKRRLLGSNIWRMRFPSCRRKEVGLSKSF